MLEIFSALLVAAVLGVFFGPRGAGAALLGALLLFSPLSFLLVLVAGGAALFFVLLSK